MLTFFSGAAFGFFVGFLLSGIIASGRDRGWSRTDHEITGFQALETLRRAKR